MRVSRVLNMNTEDLSVAAATLPVSEQIPAVSQNSSGN